MSVSKLTVPVCHCERCGHIWIPRGVLKMPEKLPVRCGNKNCNSPYWNILPKPRGLVKDGAVIGG